MIKADSKEAAVDWARRCPAKDCMIEVRQVFELTDFPEEVQESAETSAVKAHLEQVAR
jgi:hypothetical protein